MRIRVNGDDREVAAGLSVAGFLKQLEVPLPHVAVELNRDVVPRALHAETILREGDELEVVTLVGGG